MSKVLVALLTTLFTLSAQAQSASAPAPAPVSAAKKELVNKLLVLQKPGIETLARAMVEQPAMQMLQQAANALRQRVPADKREAVGKEIQADAKKYVETTAPLVRDRAVALTPSTIGSVLEQKMSDDELKQVIAAFESPGYRKFQALGQEMQRSLGAKLVADVRPTIETNLRSLEQSISKRLAAAAAAPASAASK